MAMSFARPDPSSPAAVADAAFGTSRRGFDQAEVREFLRMVAAELGRLQERERFLERELRTAQTNPDLDNVRFDDSTLTRLLGEETARVLVTAREASSEIRDKAEQNAARLLSEASDEAVRLREEAEVEASRRRSDAASDAEAELAMAKQQGREMVNEARAYRERVLSELARRRELAREQIEQLMHGRDRLMQAFERARVVAVDVVAELKPLGEPDEYVDLSPTTGPVPVMVPNSRRPFDESEHQMQGPPTQELSVDEPADDEPGSREDSRGDGFGADTGEPTDVDETSDAEASGDGSETDDVVDLGPVDIGPVDIEPVHIEPVDTERADMERADMEPADMEPADDVVVDLFARLRADAAPGLVETEPEAEIEPGAEPVVDTAGETVGELDDTVAPDGTVVVDALTPFDIRDAELTPLIVASARKLKRVLADEQNEVLDGLRRSEPVRALDAIVPLKQVHVDRFASAIDDELRAAAAAGASSVATGRAAKLNKAAMTTVVSTSRDALGEWLVSPLRERLDRCVADGAGDNEAIARSVRSIYREWKTQHIDEQLDDVLRTAHGRAVLAAVPDGAPVCWGVDAQHPACADGDDNALAGSVAAGTPFPTGHLFAPSHVGCRCLLVPADR